jgi:tetratricopeptide (TPR) repeat protein
MTSRFFLIVALVVLLPHSTRALDEKAELERRAGEHFDDAVELYGEGNLDAALVEFERAYELVPNPRVLFNLAQVQAERHQYAAAIGLYERYLEQAGESVSAERRSELQEELARLQKRVGRLWVESDVGGAKLFLDDELAATLPLSRELPLDPGVARLRLEAPDGRTASRVLKVASGDKLRIHILLSAPGDGSELATGALAPAPREVADYRPLWASLGATALLTGGAITFGVLARNADDELDAQLARFPSSPSAIEDQRRQLKTFAGLTDGLALAALAGAGLSIYFAVAPPRRERRVSSLAWTARPDGIVLRGRF